MFVSLVALIVGFSLVGAAASNPITWHPPQTIAQTEIDYVNPQIAVANGQAFIVWEHVIKGLVRHCILFSSFDGTEWHPPVPLSGNETANRFPSIAVESERIHVVWSFIDSDEGDMDIIYRLFDGTTWLPETKIGLTDPIEEWESQIVADGNQLHLVWRAMERNPWRGILYYRHFDGETWQPPVEIGLANSSNNQVRPALAAVNGTVHVVWEAFDPESIPVGIFYQQFDGEKWHPPELISPSGYLGSFGNPALAVNGRTVHVVWEVQGLSGSAIWEQHEFDIYYRQYDGTSWQALQGVSPIGAYLGFEEHHQPAIVAQSGQLCVAWLDFNTQYAETAARLDFPYAIMCRQFDGTTWQPESIVQEEVSHRKELTLAGDLDALHVAWTNYYVEQVGQPKPSGVGLYHCVGTIRAEAGDGAGGFVPGGEGLVATAALVITALYGFKHRSKRED